MLEGFSEELSDNTLTETHLYLDNLIANKIKINNYAMIEILEISSKITKYYLMISGFDDKLNNYNKFYENKKKYKNNPIIYFIQNHNTKFIKIGTTNDFKKRLDKFKTYNPEPLIVLGTIPGSYKLEKLIHNLFIKYKFNREWFYNNPQLIEFINEIKSKNVKSE